MKSLTVADVMTTAVIKARTAMPLKELARVLAENHISALPVLDADDRLIGMASERDVLVKQGHPSPERTRWWQTPRRRDRIRRATADTAGHLMTPDPVTIDPEAPLAEAARRMDERAVKRLPVVDGRGRMVGIVSRSDLLKAFLRTDEEIREEILTEVFAHVLWTDSTGLDITVQDGIVTMEGTVEQRSTAEIAEKLVRRLDGVVDVISTLEFRIDDSGPGRRW